MNQRVLVTAGASGIGREIARPFAANGAALFGCDVDAKALEALAQEISGVETTVCDLSKRQDIERMVGAAVSAPEGISRRFCPPRSLVQESGQSPLLAVRELLGAACRRDDLR
jgi:NAD(P)-dependent dehydrogenase (short-subunit alcohol dehydrogenase family)